MDFVTNTILIHGPIAAVFDLVTSARYWHRWHPATSHVGGVIVRLEPRRYRELSEPPAPGRQPTASAWAKLDDAKPHDYFLRLEHADCRSAPRGTAYFVTADACCDTVPPTDDACLLKLPAIAPPPKELEAFETGE